MASTDKGLEEWFKEVGDRLTSPPADVEELIALLDKTESLLLRVEQSPPQSISNAIRPAMTALVARGFLEHSDLDVKAGLASCISEITRITAPDAPYDDNLMKEIFERFVETFEHLDDVSSRSFSKKIAVLETLAKVRSCVVMLDLECDVLILKMFQHFFKTIGPGNARIVFSPMETIMVLVLEESEDISPELISCLLESVKIDNKDILPIAHELGEKVISSCAAKIKPYLSELFQSVNLQSYNSVVASICQDAPDVLEQNDMAAPGDIMGSGKVEQEVDCAEEATGEKSPEQSMNNDGSVLHDNSAVEPSSPNQKSKRPHHGGTPRKTAAVEKKDLNNLEYKGSGKVEQEVDCAEEATGEKSPEQSMNNDGSVLHDNSAVEPSSPNQKSKRPRHGGTPRKTAAVEKKDLNNLESVGEDPNSTSVPVAKKLKGGMPVNSLCSQSKEHDNLSIFAGTPANDVEACSGKKLKSPVVADNGTCKVSLSTEVGTPDTIQRKRGRPNSKLSSKKGGSSGANKSSTLEEGNEMNDKVSSSINNDSAVDLEQKPSVPDDETEPNIIIDSAEAPSDATSPSEDKTSKQSNKRASISKVSQVMSLQTQKSTTKQHDELKNEDRNGEHSLKEIRSSGKKAHKTQGMAEEKVKSSSKHARGGENSPKTSAQHEGLDGSLVGSRIKVWWPDDEQYYEGTVETYNPSSKKHKILYDDGDIEILLLKKERWVLLDKDHKKVEGQVKDNSFPDASSEEPQSKRTKISSSSVSMEHYRGTESNPPKRKGRPPKDISLAEDKPNYSRKVIGKFATKKNAGANSDFAEDIPSDTGKAIGKSHSKKDAGTKSSLAEDIPSDSIKAVEKSNVAEDSPIDLSKAIEKSASKKEVDTKSNVAQDIPSVLSKATGRSTSKKEAGTKSNLAEDTPSDSSKATGKSACKKDAGTKSASKKEAGTKSNLVEDIPSDSSKVTGKFASEKESGTKSNLAEDTPSDSSKATGKSTSKKDANTKSASKKKAGTKSNLAEDIPSDSSKATGKFAPKKESGTKSNLAEDTPSDSSKATGKSTSKKDANTKSASERDSGTKSNLAEDIPSDLSKTTGKPASKRDTGTNSTLAEDIPSDSSEAIGKSSKKDAGTKSSISQDVHSDSL